ncbi:MAG: SIS domain-containing protein [Solirubrobacteraceae bacterium]
MNLSEMIAVQPQALRALAELDVEPHAQRLRDARRILLVGTGTSHHAALLGAYLLRGGGLDADAIASSELAHWRPAPASGDALVLITHTGETAYARAVRAAALAAGTPLVTITGDQVDWAEALHTGTHERSETYTVSYTAALAVLALLAEALTGVGTGAKALRQLADRVQAVIADPGISQITAPPRALALIGPGIWGVTAREGALKLRESAHLLAEGFDSEKLLHGFAVPYGPADTLIALAPGADPDGLTSGLVRAAAGAGMTTHVLGDGDPGAGAAGTFLAQILATVRLQLLAAQIALANRTDADTVISGPWAKASLWAAGAPLASGRDQE